MFTHQYELARMAPEIVSERVRKAENDRIAFAMSHVAETHQVVGSKPVSTSRRPLLNPLASWVLQLIRQ